MALNLFRLCFLVLISAVYVQATPCLPGDRTYQGKVLPLVQVDTSRKISGTFEVIDGCSFRIRGFTLNPPALSTYFYGAQSVKNATNQFRVHGDQLGAFVNVDRVFNLTSSDNTGDFKQMYSWSEFNTLKIYSEASSKTLAYVQLGPDLDAQTSDSARTQSAYPGSIFIFVICMTVLLLS